MTDGGPDIVIRLRPQKDPVPRMARLRRGLKYLFRACNCRCISIEEVPAKAPGVAQDRADAAGVSLESIAPAEGVER
jgi:hypothetical protein